MKPLQGNLFDGLAIMIDDKDSLVSINAEVHILANEIKVYVIASIADTNGSVGPHFPHKMLPINTLDPGVRIDKVRKRRQLGELREGDRRWEVATGESLMGALGIVMNEELLSDFLNLLKGLWAMHL